MAKRIHVIARGVILLDGHVLLAQGHGKTHWFLPGGHIEKGEPAMVALAREMDEELGEPCEVGAFLAAVEHTFEWKGKTKHEVNLVFRATLPGLTSVGPVTPREEDLVFQWWQVAELSRIPVEPRPMIELIETVAGQGGQRGPASWGSTIEN